MWKLSDFVFLGSRINTEGDCNHEIKRRLLLGRMKWSEVAQSCPTLCDPVDCSLPGSSIHGILQARILEWVAISFSRGMFPTQGSNPGLLHCRQISYRLNYKGSPYIEYIMWNARLDKGEWKSWLKIQHSKKIRSWHPVPSLHSKQKEKKWKCDRLYFLGLPYHCGWWLQAWN